MLPCARHAPLWAFVVAVQLVPTPAFSHPREIMPAEAVSETSDPAKTERARELMREGLTEWGKGNLEGARNALVKAWEVSPNPNIVSALAEIDMKLGRYREAAEYWEVYLVRYPPDYDTAQGKLAECRDNLGKLRIRVDPPDAVVTLDDGVVPRTRLNADVWLDPGTHVLRAELGGDSATQHVTVQAGETNAVSLIVPISRPVTRAAQPPPDASLRRPTAHDDAPGGGIPVKTVVLTGGAVLTVAAATVGVVYTVKANSASDDAAYYDALARSQASPTMANQDSFCAPPPGLRPEACTNLRNAAEERQRATNWAVGSYVAAGVFAAGTVATYFLWPEGTRESSQKGPKVSVAPMSVGHGLQVGLVF